MNRIWVLACFASLGCADPGAPRDPGLVENIAVIGPAWSADSREILFNARSAGVPWWNVSLSAVSVSTRARRVLGTVPSGTNTGAEHVQAPASGGHVFFATSGQPGIGLNYAIYRVSTTSGALDTLAKDARWPWFQVSADGRRLAYHSGVGAKSPGTADSLKIVDATGAFGPLLSAEKTTASFLKVLSVSADGNTFIYFDGAIREFDVASGLGRELYRTPTSADTASHEFLSAAVRWRQGEPHLLIAAWTSGGANTSVYDLNLRAGTRTLLGSVPHAIRSPWVLAWDPEGARSAVWTATKAFNCSIEGCSYSGRLYFLPGGGQPARVLHDSADGAVSPHWLDFSPNGQLLGTVDLHRLLVLTP
jgi:hypothetical protein